MVSCKTTPHVTQFGESHYTRYMSTGKSSSKEALEGSEGKDSRAEHQKKQAPPGPATLSLRAGSGTRVTTKFSHSTIGGPADCTER